MVKIKKRSDKIDFEKERRKDKNTIMVIIIIAAVVAALVGLPYLLNVTPHDSGQAAVIDGIQCDNTLHGSFNITAHLNIFMNGQSYTIPAKIGVINNTCLYWIHTIDTSGIIYIEAPNVQQITINQLFDIWKATSGSFPSDNFTGVYINGQQITNLNNTVIKHHDEIIVVYGSQPSALPTNYQFPPGL